MENISIVEKESYLGLMYDISIEIAIFHSEKQKQYMSTFYDRLIEEKKELDTKIQSLEWFLNSPNIENIDSQQVTLLNVQVKAMHTYSQILLERITLLNK